MMRLASLAGLNVAPVQLRTVLNYENLTHIIRRDFKAPKADLSELLGRLVFNIAAASLA
jgi:hypothetical protein